MYVWYIWVVCFDLVQLDFLEENVYRIEFRFYILYGKYNKTLFFLHRYDVNCLRAYNYLLVLYIKYIFFGNTIYWNILNLLFYYAAKKLA